MDYKKMLIDHFGNVIISAKLTNSFGNTFEVVVNYTDLNDVEDISRKISDFLDTQEWFNDEYTLEVLSKGEDLEIRFEQIGDFINNDVKVTFSKSFNSNEFIIAKILENLNDEIKFLWNQKGNIRKILIPKSEIKKIEKYIKF
ncbi:ribosome assembly cofactor RimP [Mycoplasmopsis cynos]|uniref:ribosome assembly cofactor RimP n=1 Tax=Mycoplasmopsis cynos TaxID=171284 RepID=UPI0021FE9D53|nr:ribosome assembly cofactor RimP [Mycoplasmopsis cynos]UWV77805.1 ribosome assembly cofactor RimP [Mycoplasmopsis cynos]UWV92513.1 ribosome assembly cofactor RimP [Mycoplasmopsis cynos]WAM05079.1 ribosome assembly cofactor RimP [Mycoplasmopsis cynos]WAM07538.1 ribosome assembly cofactor RimP [Mycoplasmopsis cynos]